MSSFRISTASKIYQIIFSSIRSPILIIPCNMYPPHLYCDLSWKKVSLFRVSFTLLTRTHAVSDLRQNRYWSVNSTYLQLHRILNFSSSISFERMFRYEYILLVYIQNVPLLKRISYWSLDTLRPVSKRKYLCCWIFLCVLFQRVLDKYISSVAMSACMRNIPNRLRTFSAYWLRYHSLETICHPNKYRYTPLFPGFQSLDNSLCHGFW